MRNFQKLKSDDSLLCTAFGKSLTGQVFIFGITAFGEFFRFCKENFCPLGEGTRQGGKAVFAHHELMQFTVRFTGVENERILACLLVVRVVMEDTR